MAKSIVYRKPRELGGYASIVPPPEIVKRHPRAHVLWASFFMSFLMSFWTMFGSQKAPQNDPQKSQFYSPRRCPKNDVILVHFGAQRLPKMIPNIIFV